MSTDSDGDEIPAEQRSTWLDDLQKSATKIIKSFGAYLIAFAIAVTTLFALWAKFGLAQSLGKLGLVLFALVLLVPFIIAFLTDTLPRHRKKKRCVFQSKSATDSTRKLPP